MRWLSRLGLQLRIGLLAVLGLSVAFGAFAFLGLRAVEERSAQIQNERLAVARTIAGELDRSLAHTLRMLERTAAREEVSLAGVGGTPPDVEAWRHALEDAYRLADLPTYRVLLLSREGRIVLSVPDDPEVIDLDLSDQASVRETLATGKPTVSNFLPAALLGQPVVALSVPVRNDQGDVAGLLVQLVDLRDPGLSALLRHAQAGETGYAQLVDGDGTVIATTRPQNLLREWEHRPVAPSLLTAGQPEAGIYPTVEGSEGADLLAFAPLSVAGWGVTVEQEVDEALAPVRRLRWQFLSLGLAALLTALCLLCLVWITTRQVVRPVRELTAAARRIAGGELDGAIAFQGEDEIGELARAFEEMRTDMQRRTRELSVLHQTALAGAGAGDVDELVARVTEILAADLYPENAGFLFLDPEGERLHLHPSYHGAAPETLDLTLDLGEGVTGTVAQTGEPLLVPDVEAEPGYIEISSAVRSEVCVPVRVGGQVVGVINVESAQQDAFSQEDLHLLSAVAGQVGTALARLRLFEEAQPRTSELEALREVTLDITARLELSGLLRGIIRRAAELLGATGGGLYLYHPEQEELELVVSHNLGVDYTGRRLKVGEGLSGRVVASGQPLIVGDYHTWEGRAPQFEEEPFRAVIGVPLRWQERVLGVINVADLGERRPFDKNDLHLLEAFARQAAVAIENARLYAQAEQRAGELEAIARVGGLVTAAGDLQATLDTLTRKIAEATSFDAVEISLYDAEREQLSFLAVFTTRPMKLLERRGGTVTRLEEAPVLQELLRHKRYIIFHDPHNDPRIRAHQRAVMKEDGVQTVVSWPLLYGETLIGALDLFSTRPRSFSAEDINLLSTLAGQTATAIQNARLYAEAGRRADQLRALREASRTLTSDLRLEAVLQRLAETAQHLADARYAALAVLDAAGKVAQFHTAGLTEAERQRIGEPPQGRGLLGTVLRDGVPVRIADLTHDPRATGFPPHHPIMKTFMGVPIVARGKVIGSLYLTDKTDDQPFTQEDEDLVLGLAADAAIAIENARLFGEVERLAVTDGLTGLYNVRYFYQALERELERSRRYGHRCSLIMLDLDDFKRYNDRYGHLAGDDLLRELAGLIRREIRETDTAARYGGEEFVVILPETNEDHAVALAERLRETVRDHEFVVREAQRLGRITISLGVATYPGDAQDVEGLVNAADMALLRAKETKDRVCVAAD